MKKCLIIVDFQNDFVTGSLGFPGAERLDAKITEKIRIYRAMGDDVIFTLDTHREGYLGTREGRFLPIPHCIAGCEGHRIFGETGKHSLPGDRCFEKCTFGSDELYEYLKTAPYDSIELVGLVSHICVLSNAVLARTARPEAEVSVDASCIGAANPADTAAALSVLNALQVIITGKQEA